MCDGVGTVDSGSVHSEQNEHEAPNKRKPTDTKFNKKDSYNVEDVEGAYSRLFAEGTDSMKNALGQQVSADARLHDLYNKIENRKREFEKAIKSICRKCLDSTRGVHEDPAAADRTMAKAEAARERENFKVWDLIQIFNLQSRLVKKADGDTKNEHIELSGGRHRRVGFGASRALQALIGTDALKVSRTMRASGAAAAPASLAAFGGSPAQIDAMRKGVDKARGRGELHEQVKEYAGRLDSTYRGLALEALKFLDDPNRYPESMLPDDDLTAFQNLKHDLERTPSRMVTFVDLKLLLKLNPEQFKDLTISAGGEGVYRKRFDFNAEATPDVAVAHAVIAASPERASLFTMWVEGKQRVFDYGSLPSKSACDLKLIAKPSRDSALQQGDGSSSLNRQSVPWPRWFLNLVTFGWLGGTSVKSDDLDANTWLDADLGGVADRAERLRSVKLNVLRAIVDALPPVGTEQADIRVVTGIANHRD